LLGALWQPSFIFAGNGRFAASAVGPAISAAAPAEADKKVLRLIVRHLAKARLPDIGIPMLVLIPASQPLDIVVLEFSPDRVLFGSARQSLSTTIE